LLFFTHCGLHGTMEAAWHGVPQVALPVFVDQLDVANMLVRKGVAVLVSKSFDADQLHQAIETVLKDPRYGELIIKGGLRQILHLPSVYTSRILAKTRHLSASKTFIIFLQFCGKSSGTKEADSRSGRFSIGAGCVVCGACCAYKGSSPFKTGVAQPLGFPETRHRCLYHHYLNFLRFYHCIF
jgi:hypothetical protein